ncbi:MAG: hypothetical protein AAFP70_19125, partial [Calditrichota bacterium]
MRFILALCVLLLSVNELYSQDESEILHPYRHFETSSTFSNGIAFDGNYAYLSAIFDGHFYKYRFNPSLAASFTDAKQLRKTDSNQNVAGAMVIDDNKLYAATTFSFDRKPEIYIFDLSQLQTPLKTITKETLYDITDDKSLYSFYNPVVVGNYIYWGVCHTQSNSGAKILRLNTKDYNDVRLFTSKQVKANYTYGITVIGRTLFASTETGKILRLAINNSNGRLRENRSPIDISDYGISHI